LQTKEQSHDDVNDLETPRPGFEIVHIGVDRRMLVNRQRRLKMYRCWMQAVFRKAGMESEVPTSTLRRDKEEEEVEEEEEHGQQQGESRAGKEDAVEGGGVKV
jgi:tRNAThr (cytosine32-N3)-methyltransferase